MLHREHPRHPQEGNPAACPVPGPAPFPVVRSANRPDGNGGNGGDDGNGGDGRGTGPGKGTGTDLLLETRTRPKRPPLYKVLLLNDDFTPMEFVVHVLERFFGLSHAQSFEIMLTVHKKGVAVVGVFSAEIAETKVSQVMDFARRHQHPLQCTMEKE